jgi:hypothetical protein
MYPTDRHRPRANALPIHWEEGQGECVVPLNPWQGSQPMPGPSPRPSPVRRDKGTFRLRICKTSVVGSQERNGVASRLRYGTNSLTARSRSRLSSGRVRSPAPIRAATVRERSLKVRTARHFDALCAAELNRNADLSRQQLADHPILPTKVGVPKPGCRGKRFCN